MARGSTISCVTVFGGSGFLGSAIVAALAANGTAVRIACRHPDNAVTRSLAGSNTNIMPVYADVRDETSVALAVSDCDAIINAVGLYVQSGSESFEAVHELGAVNVAHQAAQSGIKRLVHISGIGANLHSRCEYIRARAKGELLVQDIFSRATILRPSVLFGPNDAFLNTLSDIARSSPVLPLFGRGRTQLQPVYVGDVAAAAVNALTTSKAQGKIYELGGPDVYSYRSLIELVLDHSRRRRLLLPVPFPVWQFLAVLFSLLPTPPVTKAQVNLMRQDNLASEFELTFQDLGIDPTSLHDVLPQYGFSKA